MSSDESTATHISTVSNKDNLNEKLKAHKSEQWEIKLIGDFLLGLYHRLLLGSFNDWCIKKSEIRKEFSDFITHEQSKRLKDLNGTCDIGTLISRCGFLMNTPRGSPFYKIKYSALFDFRNDKLKELDDLKRNIDGIKQNTSDKKAPECTLLKLSENKLNIEIEENLELDENEPQLPLEYQGTTTLQRIENYYATNTSCCICQEDFTTMETYEEHIQKHGEDTDFEFLNTMSKDVLSVFTMSYTLCKNSHYFCFEFETMEKNLIIEKIIIVQSRSFYYVQNMRVPYKISENGKGKFFVDSHLFTRHVEQPIVLICHLENDEKTRIIEQHHFMRSEAFPTVNFSTNPNRLPNKKTFKPKFELADYFPPKEIQDALKDDFYYEKLMKTNNDFRDYVRNGKNLQPQNIGSSLNILLQIEDMDTTLKYINLTQKDIKLRSYGDEYSFQLKPKQRMFIENLLSAYDEVVLTTSSTIFNKNEDIMNLMLKNKDDIKRMEKTFVGIVQAVNTGRVSFKCDRKININDSYTVICRPSRLNLRYQYRSLELLPISMDFLKKFLFPAKIIPRPLATNSLILYNPNIIGEQLQAVRNIAEGPRNDATYIIFGPPGTGKTTVLVEAILQVLKKPDTKILIAASSNSACDEVAVRLCKYLKELDIARAMVRIYSRSSENRVETIDDELLENSNMYNGQFYPDIDVLHEYRVVVCTLSVVSKLATGKFGRQFNGSTVYTHLFIDEVAASMEAEALIAITTVLTSKSCLIISGDHKQLGPILQSNRAKELGLDVSLMERLLARDCYRVDVDTGDYDRTIQTRLIRNYRSHPAIVNLYSGLYYNHSLEAYAKKDDVSLCEIWYKSRNKEYPIIFHAIHDRSTSDRQSHSLYNLGELKVVMDYVKDLMYFGINDKPVKENDIGIISPYKKQYRRIQEELNLRKWFGIETGSVETFQGKEKDIIIVSFVRSGTDNLGFLDDPRRLNVTLSRAKSLLIMIGNPKTLSLNSDFEYIIKECQRNNTFVGSKEPTKRADLRKQSTGIPAMSQENLPLLSKGMQDLSIENTVQEKNTEKSTNRNRRRGARRRNNSKSKRNKEHLKEGKELKETKNDKNNVKGEEDDEDDDNDKCVKLSRAERNKLYSNRAAAGGGKISKKYNKGKQNNCGDNGKVIGKKIEKLFDELPKVPTPLQAPKATPTTFKYTKEQVLQMQQQQIFYQNSQRQLYPSNNSFFNSLQNPMPVNNINFNRNQNQNHMPINNTHFNFQTPYMAQQQQQYTNSYDSNAGINKPNLACFRNVKNTFDVSKSSNISNKNAETNKPKVSQRNGNKSNTNNTTFANKNINAKTDNAADTNNSKIGNVKSPTVKPLNISANLQGTTTSSHKANVSKAPLKKPAPAVPAVEISKGNKTINESNTRSALLLNNKNINSNDNKLATNKTTTVDRKLTVNSESALKLLSTNSSVNAARCSTKTATTSVNIATTSPSSVSVNKPTSTASVYPTLREVHSATSNLTNESSFSRNNSISYSHSTPAYNPNYTYSSNSYGYNSNTFTGNRHSYVPTAPPTDTIDYEVTDVAYSPLRNKKKEKDSSCVIS